MGIVSRFKIPLCAVLLTLLSTSSALANNTVIVYSTTYLSLVNVLKGVMVCNLNVKHSIRVPLYSGSSAEVSSEVTSWMRAHQSQLKAWEQKTLCRYQAKFLGLKYLPAVVMNNRYVVYGNTDIQSAIDSINHYRNQHKIQGGKV